MRFLRMKNGYVSFTFSHASDYLVVIDKQTAVKPEEPDSTESNTSQKNETTEKDKSTKNESTNTAAIYNALFYKGLLVVSLVAGFVLVVVKRESC
ncbi:hypothetical protein [Floccifex porci]|uniref:Uncharacterized protein n=1 Tax=Floccifex porci TaxID=2606629 RepID=A0A7X2N2E7_9FIRM|nr:hypothetical protein [Floccifex porci]MSS01177.1 hypothetical protein [Floccifex porci]